MRSEFIIILFGACLTGFCFSTYYGKRWASFSLVVLMLVFSAVGFTQFGVTLGREMAEMNFYSSARRAIGVGLSATADQAKRGEESVVLSKVIYMDKVWYDTKFFKEDYGDSISKLANVLMSSQSAQLDEREEGAEETQ